MTEGKKKKEKVRSATAAGSSHSILGIRSVSRKESPGIASPCSSLLSAPPLPWTCHRKSSTASPAAIAAPPPTMLDAPTTFASLTSTKSRDWMQRILCAKGLRGRSAWWVVNRKALRRRRARDGGGNVERRRRLRGWGDCRMGRRWDSVVACRLDAYFVFSFPFVSCCRPRDAVLVSFSLDLQLHWKTLMASIRCVVQLTVLGIVLEPILAAENPWYVLAMSGASHR